jgi:hypothetical protein
MGRMPSKGIRGVSKMYLLKFIAETLAVIAFFVVLLFLLILTGQ